MDALSPSDGFRLKGSGSVYLHLKTAIRIQEYVYYYLAKMVKNPPLDIPIGEFVWRIDLRWSRCVRDQGSPFHNRSDHRFQSPQCPMSWVDC